MDAPASDDDVSRTGVKYSTNGPKVDELLHLYRQKHGLHLSYEKIAERTFEFGPAFRGINEKTLRKVRGGGPVTHPTVMVVAKLLGVEPQDIIVSSAGPEDRELGLAKPTAPIALSPLQMPAVSSETIAEFLQFLDSGFAPYLEAGDTPDEDRLANMLSDILTGTYSTWTESPEGVARLGSQIDPARAKRQVDNVRYIALGAAKYLRDRVPSPASVSQTTIDQLRSHCENISDEHTQDLWSRLIAALNHDPSAFSHRSLRIMQDLTPDVAELFSKFASTLIQVEEKGTKSLNSIRIPAAKGKDLYFDLMGIDFGGFLTLQEYGLVSTKSRTFAVKYGDTFRYFDKRLQANSDFTFEVNFPTEAGNDLAKIIRREMNLAYFDIFTKTYEKRFSHTSRT